MCHLDSCGLCSTTLLSSTSLLLSMLLLSSSFSSFSSFSVISPLSPLFFPTQYLLFRWVLWSSTRCYKVPSLPDVIRTFFLYSVNIYSPLTNFHILLLQWIPDFPSSFLLYIFSWCIVIYIFLPFVIFTFPYFVCLCNSCSFYFSVFNTFTYLSLSWSIPAWLLFRYLSLLYILCFGYFFFLLPREFPLCFWSFFHLCSMPCSDSNHTSFCFSHITYHGVHISKPKHHLKYCSRLCFLLPSEKFNSLQHDS